MLKEITQEDARVLLAEQNVCLALQFARRGNVLENGSLVLVCALQELMAFPDIRKAYLGG